MTENISENPDYNIIRQPIVLSSNTVIVVHTFRCENGLDGFFLHDFIDHKKDQDKGMADLISVLSPNLSVSSLWALKEAVDAELNKINEERGTKFPLNRPEHKK